MMPADYEGTKIDILKLTDQIVKAENEIRRLRAALAPFAAVGRQLQREPGSTVYASVPEYAYRKAAEVCRE